MIAVATLSLALGLVQAANPTGGQEPLGSATIGSREVPIVMPQGSADAPGPTVQLSGGKWLLGSSGNLVRPVEVDGGWTDLRNKYVEARKKAEGGSAAIWRTHLFVFTRGEILERRADGVWRMRRSTLEPNQIDEVFRGAALFKAMVEAETRGEVSVKIDATIDDDPERVVVDGRFPDGYSQELTDRLLRARVNDDAFDADDKVFRGPFQSVFGIHCLLRPFAGDRRAASVRQTPASWIGFYTDTEQPTAAGVAQAMYREWLFQVEDRAAGQGYHRATSGDPRLWAGVWPSLVATSEPTRQEYVERTFAPPLKSDARWAEYEADPWRKLPMLDVGRLAELAGVPSDAALQDGGDEERAKPLLNNRFEPSLEACALLGSGENQLLLVRDDAVASLAPAIEQRPGSRLFGYSIVRGRRVVAYGCRGLASGVGESVALGLVQSLPERQSPGSPRLVESLTSTGQFSVVQQQDSERGAVLAVTEKGSYRWGSASLYARNDGGILFDLAATPTLEFSAKLESRDAFLLELVGLDGSTVASVALGTPPAEPVGGLREPAPTGVVHLQSGAWASVKANFRSLASGVDTRIREVRVVPSAYSRLLERRQIDPGRVLFAGFSLSDAASDWGQAEPVLPEDERLSRVAAGLGSELAEADENTLLELLKSRNETVRLNAVAVLTRAKSAKALPILIEQSKSATPAIAEMALRALRFQGTAEAWDAVRWCVNTGPFDHNRTSAAIQLAERGDPKDAATVSVLLAARSWHARLAAATALSRMASREASIILMAFLQESEPAVRLAVVEGADLTQELVNRRLLYLAVNDPSQAVRARCYVRLLETSVAEFRDEALKGVRDESLGIRVAILDAMSSRPSERYRGALRIAVIDVSPTVRARALAGFAKLPDPVQVDEFENVLSDGHPVVQLALLDLVAAKSIKLPEPAVQALTNSVDPLVVERAKGLNR